MVKAISQKKINQVNLSVTHFEKLIGVSTGSVGRYMIGKLKKEESIKKIEVGAQVLSELGLVWPSVKYVPNNEKLIKEYEKNKKKSEKLDKKFQTAFKKALKKAGF